MISVNTVMIAGRLTGEPKLRETGSGVRVGSFGVAVNERYTSRDGEDRERTAFADVEVWGRQAEACAQYLGRGAPVFVEGKLETNCWDDRETGERRSRVVVRAHRVQFLQAPPDGNGRGADAPDANAAVGRRAEARRRSNDGRRGQPQNGRGRERNRSGQE